MIAKLYRTLTRAESSGPSDGEGETSRDEAFNGAVHVAALSLTKISDGLVNPKLVLAWLMNSLGAPGYLIGFLVPVREAGALLPQLTLARWVENSRRRKWFWVAGSLVQGIAAFGLAGSAIFLEGDRAGWSMIGCLAVLSLGRAFCSISQKDALARTIPKQRRGSVTGAAGSAASLGVLVFGILLAAGIIPMTTACIAAAIAVAGAAWFAGALIFSALREPASDPVAGERTLFSAFVAPLGRDAQLRWFIFTRAMLTATALAPPFIVMLTSAGNELELGHLGPLVLASGAASILSAYIWGRLSDTSSRKTLLAAACLGASTFAATGLFGLLGGGSLGMGWNGMALSAASIFFAQIAHEGVRAGRKLHLTDMADDDNRARYTALSNSLIGIILLLGGAWGSLSEVAGPAWTLVGLACLCACAIPAALCLQEVQQKS